MLAALTFAGLGIGCRGAAPPPPATLDEVGERYVRLTLALARHQPSLVETWLGPAAWRPGPREPVAAVGRAIDDLRVALDASAVATTAAPAAHDDVRRRYLAGQLAALTLAAHRLSGRSSPMADEAEAALGADVAALLREWTGDEVRRETAAALATLERRLPGRGSLAERHAAFRRRHALEPARVLPTVQTAAVRCRDRLASVLAWPPAESIAVELTSGLGLAGSCTYEGEFRSRVRIDPSGGLDLASLVWLVAHETYAGHHLQHVFADRDLVLARGWTERQLWPAFGRHLLVAEGAADAGAALLLDGDDFEALARDLAPDAGVDPAAVVDLVAVHRATAALDPWIAVAARGYLDATLSRDEAVTLLRERALVADAEAFLFIVERQRSRLLAYPIGRRLVLSHIAGDVPAHRWTRLSEVSTTLTLPYAEAQT